VRPTARRDLANIGALKPRTLPLRCLYILCIMVALASHDHQNQPLARFSANCREGFNPPMALAFEVKIPHAISSKKPNAQLLKTNHFRLDLPGQAA